MKKLAMLFAVIIMAAVVYEKASHKEATGDLFWANVEALAIGELNYPEGECFGSGSVTCPRTGAQVLYAWGMQNVEPEYEDQ